MPFKYRQPDPLFARTARALDFSDVRRRLAGFCKTESGAAFCRSLSPVTALKEAERLLDLTEEGMDLKRRGYELFPRLVENPAHILKKISRGALPEPDDVKSFLTFTYQCDRIAAFSEEKSEENPRLKELFSAFDPMAELTSFFEYSFDGEGKVKPTATARLMELEERINFLRKNIVKKAEGMFTRPDVADQLREEYITTRYDRIVIPIKAEYKNVFPGIIHGISATRQTAFMEPQELVKENNSLQEALSEREEEVTRILREAAGMLRENEENIKNGYGIMGMADSVCARAEFSLRIGGVRPRFTPDGSMNLEELKHPMMVIRNEKPRANDVKTGPEEKAFVISGPNAGGKTVLLKSIGLSAALPSCGILPSFAPGSGLPFIPRLFALVGDEQSIEEGRSTFSAQLYGIKEAIEKSREGDMVIVDEILNGTDPKQAAALALTVIEHLMEKGCRVWVSTHLPELKITAQQREGMVNGAMGFGDDGKPSFRLEKGHPGVSYPLEVAASVGIPEGIISRAREKLSTTEDLYQNALKELQQKSEDLEKETSRYRSLKLQAEQLERELSQKAEAARIQEKRMEQETNKKVKEEVARARKGLSEILEQARRADRKERERTARSLKERENRLVEEIKKPDSVPLESLKPGDPVWIIPFDRPAELGKLEGNKVEVVSGGVRMTLARRDVMGVKEGRKPREKTVKPHAGQQDDQPAEISLLGLTFEESVAELEPFMDRHMLGDNDRIRVIHGRGKLKGKIIGYLMESPYVSSVEPAPRNLGGDGASIVTLG